MFNIYSLEQILKTHVHVEHEPFRKETHSSLHKKDLLYTSEDVLDAINVLCSESNRGLLVCMVEDPPHMIKLNKQDTKKYLKNELIKIIDLNRLEEDELRELINYAYNNSEKENA